MPDLMKKVLTLSKDTPKVKEPTKPKQKVDDDSDYGSEVEKVEEEKKVEEFEDDYDSEDERRE